MKWISNYALEKIKRDWFEYGYGRGLDKGRAEGKMEGYVEAMKAKEVTHMNHAGIFLYPKNKDE
jgi:hypothetical protein